MRARDFLIEYDRAKTAQNLGQKLAAKARTDRTTYAGSIADPASVSDEVVIAGTLQSLENADPTTNKQYVQWLARLYSKDQTKMEDIYSTIHNYLVKFHKLNQQKKLVSPANDINRYPSFNNFMDVMDTYDNPAEPELVDKGKAEQVFNDASVRVIVPRDEPAACYYGQGTRWCTAATKGHNYFNQYSKNGSLYILLPKKPQYDGEKYQLHFGSEQFMDENDEPIDVLNLIQTRFPSLQDFFLNAEPSMQTWMAFTPDAVLKPLTEKIQEIIMNEVYSTIGEIEQYDDYWREWQSEQAIERGYVDANGDIDYDAVEGDDALNNYMDFNDEARDYVNGVKEAINLSPELVREASYELYRQDNDEIPTLTDLEKLFAAEIERNVSDNISSNLVEWITTNIFVRKGMNPAQPDAWSVGVRKQQ